MQRFHQVLFSVSLVACSWLGMMAVHELGHVVGAVFTSGSVERVVLHPLSISRTDVLPNPHPAVVVWLGPVVGCIIPILMLVMIPQHLVVLRNSAQFFAGFCLVANGAYIAIGSFDGIGDCGEMLRTGTPLWAMPAFGAMTIPLGFYLWHGLGSFRQFIDDPTVITRRMAYTLFGVLLVTVIAGLVVSPQ